jgi:long-subunit fatty acid transport protein
MKRAVCTSVLAVVFSVGTAFAQSKTGTTIGQFMGIEPSARIAAMGNAGVALYDGIQCIYYNPAAAAPLSRPALQFTHAYWFADIAYDYAAALLPVGRLGTLFGSVTTLNSGDIDVRTVDQPLGTGEHYGVQDVGLSAGWGREFTARFGAGVQVNYLSETIWHSSLHTVTINAGTVYRLTESGLALGSSLSNFGTRARFSGRDLAIQYDNDPNRHGDNSTLPADQFTDEFPVPILFRVGMSYPRRLGDTTKVLVSVDAFHPSDNTESISAGWEWSWKDALSLRAGYQNLYQRDSELGLTAGLGLRGGIGKNRFQFDYAWAYHSILNETHRLTFALTL